MASENSHATAFFAANTARKLMGQRNQARAASRSRPNALVAISSTPRCAYTAATSSGCGPGSTAWTSRR